MKNIVQLFQKEVVVGVVLVVVALLLRLPLLDGSFWLDEAAQAFESSRPLSQQLQIREDFQPPLLHLMLHVATYISVAEWWLRLIGALIPGLITVYFTYKIGTQIRNRLVGIWAALLLSLSSFHIFYSQELRPYSLPACIGIVAWWCVLQIEKHDTSRAWVGFAVLSIAGLYASYLYPFLLLTQLLYLWFLSTAKQKFWSVIAALGVAGIPWLPYFFEQLQVGQSVRAQLPNWEEVVSSQLHQAPFLVVGKMIFGVLDLSISVPYALVAGLICVFIGCIMLFIKRNHTNALLFLCWVILPVLLAWLVSFFIPVLQPKRVLFILPGAYLLLGSIIYTAVTDTKRVVQLSGVGLLALFIAINIYGTAQYYTNPELQRENWRAVVERITTDYPAQDVAALFAFQYPLPSWQWYNQGTIDTYATGALNTGSITDLTAAVAPVMDYEYVVTFDYLTDLTDPERQVIGELKKIGYTEIMGHSYPHVGAVRIFAHVGSPQAEEDLQVTE